MSRLVELRTAVLAKNDGLAAALRSDLDSAGTAMVSLLSSPGSGKTALLQRLLAEAVARDVAVAAITGDLATENDARRLAEAGAPVRQIVTDGLCHLEADLVRDHLAGWLPADTRLLFCENVGNLVCPASYDLGESLRLVMASVTEGEDKPVKYPTAYRWADAVVLTKVDLAEPCDFDLAAFTAAVHAVRPDLPILHSSARTGEGVAALFDHIQDCLTQGDAPWAADAHGPDAAEGALRP